MNDSVNDRDNVIEEKSDAGHKDRRMVVCVYLFIAALIAVAANALLATTRQAIYDSCRESSINSTKAFVEGKTDLLKGFDSAAIPTGH